MDIVDPDKGKEIHLLIDKKGYDYAKDYYATIYLLVNKDDMKKEQINNRLFALRYIESHDVYLGLNYFIYKLLKEDKLTVGVTKSIEKYLKEINVKNEENQDYFIGSDGVYVKYVINN